MNSDFQKEERNIAYVKSKEKKTFLSVYIYMENERFCGWKREKSVLIGNNF